MAEKRGRAHNGKLCPVNTEGSIKPHGGAPPPAPMASPPRQFGATTNANSHHMSRFNHSLFSLLKNPPFSSALSKSPINLTTTKTRRHFFTFCKKFHHGWIHIMIMIKDIPDNSKSFFAGGSTHGLVLKSESIFPEQMDHQGTRAIPAHSQ